MGLNLPRWVWVGSVLALGGWWVGSEVIRAERYGVRPFSEQSRDLRRQESGLWM